MNKPTEEQRQKMSDKAKERVGKKAPHWQGGTKVTYYGYVYEIDESLTPRNGGRYIPRYRRVIEEVIGRKLEKNETVHHINGIKSDDRPKNLYLCTLSSHRKMHNEMSRIVMELYKEGRVEFNDGRYCLCKPTTK